ncbi:MAG: GNAT family N-acetyltransferase [Alistipes sp.]
MINVFVVRQIDGRLIEAFARLMPQLSASLDAPSAESLRRMVAAPATRLFGAERDGAIVGLLTLVWYDAPSGRHAWIEDVVVDAAQRGCGAGQALVRAAMTCAEQEGCDNLSLTSNPSRVAAHALYRKAGFEPYNTTLFRVKIKK